MKKTPVEPFEYANAITKANPKGILLTTKSGDEVDTMVIGWGLMGNIWGKPTFTAFIRVSRHTYELLEASGEFTINVPEGRLDPQIFKVAGSLSGRDIDKVSELGLTLVEPEAVSAPAILECPITLECRVVYQQQLDEAAIPAEVRDRFYPAVENPQGTDCTSDIHVAYYGEIVASYIVEE